MKREKELKTIVNNDLAPCPFCGGKVRVFHTEHFDLKHRRFDYNCLKCDAYISLKACSQYVSAEATEAEACELFNNRYREQSEVEMHIFKDIEDMLSNVNDFAADNLELEPEERIGAEAVCVELGMKLAELKKKYKKKQNEGEQL